MTIAREEEFRTCAVTGLKVHLPAERLIIANLAVAYIVLALGGLFALLLALTRTPALSLIKDADLFTRVLTGHGVFMLIAWMIFFEVGAMVFTSTVLLNARIYSQGLGWLAFILMLVGAGLVTVTILSGQGNVTFTAYVPLMAHPAFYLGYIIFAVGALLAIVNFFLTIAKGRLEGTFSGSLPLTTYGVAVAGILAVVAISSGVVALVPTLLWSLGLLPSVEPIFYRAWFWGLGHTLQYTNVTAMIASWYALVALTMNAGPVNQRFTRIAFILYLLITVPVLGHHFLVDPTLSPWVKIVGGTLMGFALGVPSLMHGVAVLGALEVAVRKNGPTTLFGWLGKLPWDNPGMAALMVSMFLFAIGGFNGTVATTLQLNMVTHNNLWIPAHLHGVVVGGATVAFMGLSYFMVPLVTRREMFWPGVARIQPYIYGLGLLIMILSLNWAGILGVPRRAMDITYGGLAPNWYVPMNILGIGAVIAVIGGALFVINVLLTLIAGPRTEEARRLIYAPQP